MNHLKSDQPIGIFDSGIGGLTIARAVVDLLPNENIIYFGDTAHLPYGDKSASALQQYALKITDVLLEHHCKLILIACNSASTAAYDVIQKYLTDKAYLINVVDPVIDFIAHDYSGKTIGLIGTKQTVSSKMYQQKILTRNLDITLKSHATPLLALAIEENFQNEKIIDGLLQEYLSHPGFNNIEALILGCTHYPVIKKQIEAYFKHSIEIIDTSMVIARTVEQYLKKNHLINQKTGSTKHFYVSDYTQSFENGTKLFFQQNIHLEHYPIWEE